MRSFSPQPQSQHRPRGKFEAQEVDPGDRNKTISDTYQIGAWLGSDFRGRGGKYSKQKYHWYHFSGTNYNADNNKTAIYRILGDKTKGWSDGDDVDNEKGSYN